MEMLVLRPTTLIELGSVVLALICELKMSTVYWTSMRTNLKYTFEQFEILASASIQLC